MRIYLIIAILFISYSDIFGQSRADKLYERGDYLGALRSYQRELEGGDKSKEEHIRLRMASSFFHLNDVVKAGQIYNALNQEAMDAEHLYYYAVTLQRAGEYNKAKDMAEMAESMGWDFYAVERLKESCDFALKVAKERPQYSANKTNVDFAGFSSGMTYYKGRGIILAAPSHDEQALKDTRGYKFTRLYNVILASDGRGGKMMPFADELGDKYHIGAVSFTKDFNRIYYTKTTVKKDGTSILKLLTAENVDGKWDHITELNINSDDYSCAHPCLYRDSLLFFVSDMPGGYGGKDIYMATIDGAYCGDVQNLGEVVNTPDEEMFPFVDQSGRLYFASNGHLGLGGLDLFETQPDGETWTTPRNMGRPINSSMDDFALVFKDTTNTEGFVSSNRGGTGYYDFLFGIKELPKPKPASTPAKKELAVAPETQVQPEPEQVYIQAPQPLEEIKLDYNYAIQVGAFRNPVPRVYFDQLQGVKVYKGYDNIYRYAVGEYPDEFLANRDAVAVRNMIRDAFVINVDRYVAEGKIRNGKEGDKIDDNELLLIRLRNFELEKQRKQGQTGASAPAAKRYIDKPWVKDEVSFAREGYTVVLMSVNKMLDMSMFSGIDVIDVYQIEDGTYNYCSDTYATITAANAYLQKMRRSGFKNAYIVKVDISGNLGKKEGKQEANKGLKDVLDKYSF